MGYFGSGVPVPGRHVGARVRNTVPGDFYVDTGTVIETSGVRDVRVIWDDETTPDPDRGWWKLGRNVEYIAGT